MAHIPGRIMTLGELFAEREAEMKAYIQTPEYAAQQRRLAEKMARERAAQEAFEAANPPTPYELGGTACAEGKGVDEVPEHYTEEEKLAWCTGWYDAEADRDEEAAEDE